MNNIYDSLINLVSGLGGTKDKRIYDAFTSINITRNELDNMYTCDWLAGKIVDIPVEDLMRKGRTFISSDINGNNDIILNVEKYYDENNVYAKVSDALKCARLYGGCGIVIGVDGTGLFSEPLDNKLIKRGNLKFMHVVDCNDLKVESTNSDFLSKNYQKPEYYIIGENRERIHYSRVIQFNGIDMPYNIRRSYGHYGISVLQRVYEAVRNASLAASASASLIHESNVDIITVQDLFSFVASGKEADLINRFKLAQQAKSNFNMLLLDNSETYTTKSISFGALPELITRYLTIAAAAADIPATRLLGQSAQGLNATGEGDEKNYITMLESKQESLLRPVFNKLDNIILRHLGYDNVEDWTFTFDSMRVSSENEISQRRLWNAQRDQIYYSLGVVDSTIIASSLLNEGVYSDISPEYIDILKEINNEERSTEEESTEEQ